MLSMDFRKRSLVIALLPFLLALGGCGAKDSPDPYRLPESLEGPNWFVIDKTGRKVFDVPHNYKIGEYHDGLCRFAKVENGELVMGFLDPEGKIAIQPRYSYCSDFSEGRAYVSLKDSWQLLAPVQIIDSQGKIVAAAPGKVLTQTRNSSLAIVEPLSVEPMIPWYFRSGQSRRINCGLIDHNGREVVPCKFESASEFGHDMALGEGRSSTTVFDRSGHRLFEAEYSLSGGYHEGLAAASKRPGSKSEPGDLWTGGSFIFGYVDKTGEVKIPFRYCYGEAFSEGLAVVADDKGVLFIDREGRDVFGKRFEGCRSFRSGVAAVKTNGLYGFIDKSGRFVIEPQYSQAESFDGGVAVCAIATNKNLSSSPSDSFRDFLSSRFLVRPLKLPTFFEPIKLSSCFYRRLKYGLVSSSGQWLVKPIYDSMFSLRDGMRIVELDGKYGFIDANGREIIKPVFPGVSNFNDGRAIASVDPTARVWDRQSSDPVNIVSDSLDLSSGVDPGTIEDSIKVLSKVVDIAPESANAYANRGRFYYQAGCYEGALSDFQKALERKPECKNFLYWRGCSYLKLKRWRAAEKDFLQLNPSLMAVDPSRKLNNWPFNLDRVYVFDSFPMTTESKLIIARAAQGRYEGFARRMFVASRAGAKVAPKVIESPEVNLARALSGYSHTDDVLFGRCGSDSLSLARREYIYPRGELDWSILSLEKCLSRLRRNTKPDKAVLEIIDSEHGRLLDMAVRSRQRRFELAGLESLLLKRCQAMESSIRGPNPHTFACFELAEYYADLGDPRAEEIYKSVLAPGEFSKLYIDHYAFYLSRLGRDSEANALFQDGNPTGIATRRYANFLAGHGMKGKIPQLLERSRKFNCSYSREIQAFKLPELPVPDKGTAEEYFELCKTANDFGQVDAANHYLEKSRVVGKDSNWQEMLSRYKRNYLPVERIPLEVVSLFFCVVESDMRHFDFEEPRNALLKCIKEAPEYPHPYAELVNLYTFVGSYSDAEALLKVGVKQHPNFVPLRMAAGKLYLDTGRKDKAVEAYKTALNLDPTVELAQREVKRLGK